MKKLFLIMAVLLMLVGCNQQAENYLSFEGLGLKGDVVSIESEMTSAFSGELQNTMYFDMNMKIVPNYKMTFEDGKLVALKEKTPSGAYLSEKEFVYTNGNLDQIVHNFEGYGGDDNLTMDFRLDEDGDILLEDNVQTVDFLVDGKKTGSSYKVEYKDGQRVHIGMFNNGEGIVQEEESTFKNGLLSSVIYTLDGRETEITFKYQDNQMIRMNITYSGVEEIYTFDYEYDDQGNWITQNVYFNEELKSIVTRTIEYK